MKQYECGESKDDSLEGWQTIQSCTLTHPERYEGDADISRDIIGVREKGGHKKTALQTLRLAGQFFCAVYI
ncbi:hypothetical protein GCM10023188_25150 [Pontibacter saemangeumensis]|uniref:Uncharacterized protein n=1 Tax=Pontibacter saemangeumensis TaxID=1084525 RepID=A0ABP8LSB8_9BACT